MPDPSHLASDGSLRVDYLCRSGIKEQLHLLSGLVLHVSLVAIAGAGRLDACDDEAGLGDLGMLKTSLWS